MNRCAYCREYGQKEEMVPMGLSYYCSKDHMFSHQRLREKEAAPSRKSSSAYRADIIASDGGRCRYCGGGNNLAVHHIIYRGTPGNEEFENDPSNLITLCNFPCHIDIIHGNKALYQPLCQRISWLRETYGDRTTLIKDIENG